LPCHSRSSLPPSLRPTPLPQSPQPRLSYQWMRLRSPLFAGELRRPHRRVLRPSQCVALGSLICPAAVVQTGFDQQVSWFKIKQFNRPKISNSDTATCRGSSQQVEGRTVSPPPPRIAEHQVRTVQVRWTKSFCAPTGGVSSISVDLETQLSPPVMVHFDVFEPPRPSFNAPFRTVAAVITGDIYLKIIHNVLVIASRIPNCGPTKGVIPRGF